MHTKVVVITGATSGIGQAAAESLARAGARIVQIARDRERGEAAMKRLAEIAPGASHPIHYADLSRISDTQRVAREIRNAEPRIDVLINNAGAIFGKFEATEDGLERTFALNHMAYFVMTMELLPRLMESAPARVVSTSSDAHQMAKFDLDDLQSRKVYASGGFGEWLRYGGPAFQVYARSKLCNIWFTRELARRVNPNQVTANCLHPGFVATRFADQAGGLVAFGTKIAKRWARTIDKGAETIIYLASSPEVSGVTGQYFVDCRVAQPSAAAQDDAAAQRLWIESEKLAGVMA